ncbi:FlxA-like family protein [uncultured Variovorax sp.]|uniref:FlxA-like family protein n=1 Tax=uncultured Variovorax sp. TaxID=114708 RepID=UPI0025CF5B4F|nr:FlxA-like family protein [uncultured Variovorax sp.]
MLNAIGASSGAARSGSDVNAEIAKIQRQILATQKQIGETQAQLIATPEGDARELIRMQLEALAAKIAMLQQQMNALRNAEVQRSAMASLEQSAAPTPRAGRSGGSATMGSVVDVQA